MTRKMQERLASAYPQATPHEHNVPAGEEGNVVMMCPDCSAKLKEKNMSDPAVMRKVMPGAFCKVFFKATKPGGLRGDHLWVRVQSVDHKLGEFTGVVDNKPVSDCGVKYGQVVIVALDDVEDVMVK